MDNSPVFSDEKDTPIWCDFFFVEKKVTKNQAAAPWG